MKRTNFIISLLICFGLMFVVSSCNDKERPLVCSENVIICVETFNNTPEMLDTFGLPFGISNVRIEGNYLKFTIIASGCDGGSWVAKVVTDGNNLNYRPSGEAIRLLRISFENNEDCEALPRKDFSFNIECLQVPNENSVWLNFPGTEYGVLYEW